MKIYTTAPLEDPRKARTLYKELEDIGYDGGFSFEAKHDPFLALAVAAATAATIISVTAGFAASAAWASAFTATCATPILFFKNSACAL